MIRWDEVLSEVKIANTIRAWSQKIGPGCLAPKVNGGASTLRPHATPSTKDNPGFSALLTDSTLLVLFSKSCSFLLQYLFDITRFLS